MESFSRAQAAQMNTQDEPKRSCLDKCRIRLRRLEKKVLIMIPFGRLQVPLEFRHYQKYYTNRFACLLSTIALSLLLVAFGYLAWNPWEIQSEIREWRVYQSYSELMQKYEAIHF